MGEFFMGQMLDQPELPANSPRPPETPPDGIIVTDMDADGYTRRYLYKAMNGEIDEVLISEVATGKASGVAVAVEEAPLEVHSEPYLTPQEPELGTVDPYAHEAVGVPAGRPLKIPPLGATVVQPGVMPQIKAVKASPSLSGATHLRAAASPVVAPMVPDRPIQAHAAPPQAAPISASPLAARDQMTPISGVVSPNIELGRSLQVPGGIDMGVPAGTPSSFQVSHPDLGRGAPIQTQVGPLSNQKSVLQSAQRPVGGHTALMSQELRLRTKTSPALGQSAAPSATPASRPASGMEQAPSSGKCPGAVEMPDGRVVEPEDFISLNDFCELFPFLMKTYGGEGASQAGLAPGQKVPVVGQSPTANGAVPSTSQFGPAGSGPYGRTGGGFVGGGGGGPGPTGPRGFQGPTGATGPAGAAAIDTISKTDGDFTAGPGGFIPVPGTLLSFSTSLDGHAVFLLNGVLGTTTGAASESQSGQIGLRIDGTDYVVATRLIHTMAAGVAEYQIAQSGSVTLSLPAGSLRVEVVTRGLGVGEFGGTGLGTPLTVVADPSTPLNVTVLHR